MSIHVGQLVLYLLVACLSGCKGLELTIGRTPGSQFCAQLVCDQTVSQNDQRISFLIGLSVYNLTLGNFRVKLASLSLFDPELYIDPSKVEVINGTGSITRSQGHLELSFQDVADCLQGSLLCELDFVNVSGQPDSLIESTTPWDSSSCTLLEDQLILLMARVQNLTSNTQTALAALAQENAALESKVNELTQNNTVLEGKMNLLANHNLALKSTLDQVVQRLDTLESQANSSIDKPQETQLDCFKGMSSTNPRQVFQLWGYIPALCDTETDGGGWVTVQRRTRGNVDFYRVWADYRNGFGTPDTDLWIGLDVLHNLTSQGYTELRFDLQYQGKPYFAHYSNVKVASEVFSYYLEVSGYSGTSGDSFSLHNGQAFSTFDRDHDTSAVNCAERSHGAWWYKSCYGSNLNGLWAEDSEQGIIWEAMSSYVSLDSAEMKVRLVQ
ncbi:unnamed protein product [Candidula unifasciata]|uniref:Fibrinogen C-terminal domain-containing protein n=1 Tax=Candidula unifasciata TaxID=100452 RepID=A0A8S3YPE1_9EUPU|nr:unnamed protein product [Candidula unifasciata]